MRRADYHADVSKGRLHTGLNSSRDRRGLGALCHVGSPPKLFRFMSRKRKKKNQKRTNQDRQRDQDVIRPWLREFWSEASVVETFDERLGLLLRFAQYRRHEMPRGHRHRMRTGWNHSQERKLEKDLVCFVCWRLPQCWHHVIQLQHGGTNTQGNRVALCHKCHRRIHPWMGK